MSNIFSWIWNNVLYYPTLNLTLLLYHYLGDNLAWAIVVIAIFFRLLLLPLMKRQTEMTKKMSSLKPQLDALQKKYANNKERLSQEQVKLYKKVGYNPLGCLATTLPQLLIIIALLQVIRNVSANEASNLTGMYPFVDNLIDGVKSTINLGAGKSFDLSQIFMKLPDKLSLQGVISFMLAILAGVSQYFATKFTQMIQNPTTVTEKKKEKKKKNDDEMLSPEELQKSMNKSFSFMLPAMTTLIALTNAAFLSLYWVAQSIALILQYLFLDWDKTKKGAQNLLSIFRKKKELESKRG